MDFVFLCFYFLLRTNGENCESYNIVGVVVPLSFIVKVMLQENRLLIDVSFSIYPSI